MFHYKFIHIIWCFLFYLSPLTLYGQRTISGRITDADDGAPVPGVHVFIANTTVGTTTNADGYYQLKIPGEGSYQIAVSHVGYQPVFMEIEPGKASKVIDIELQIREMEDIEIVKKVKVRKNDVDFFWKTLLGERPSKKTIHATNPEDVYFYYNSETQKLTVSCRVPLQIVNYETGYQIQYVLKNFTHDYKSDNSVWLGQVMFRELEPENQKQKYLWERNREKVYRVSLANFIRSLYQNSLSENGFMLLHSVWIPTISFSGTPSTGMKVNVTGRAPIDVNFVDDDYYLSIDLDCNNNCNSKILNIPEHHNIMLICFGKPVTEKDLQKIEFARKQHRGWNKIGLFRNTLVTPLPVHIFPDGTYRNPLKLITELSSNPLNGLNKILPVEYMLEVDPVAADTSTTSEKVEVPQDIALSENPLTTPLMNVAKHFDIQLSVFPQEKVYLHTDKPYYISGERIWFRAHVADAASHTPTWSANNVFVELFDARDSVVCRVKTGMFSGYINIPEDAPEGDYTIRAYTGSMRNLDEDYYFIKNIRIGDPMSRLIQVQPEFAFMPDKKIDANIRFSSLNTSHSSPLIPEGLRISINNGKPMNVKSENGISDITFNLSSAEKQRVMLIDAKPYRKYIKIPLPDDEFDVTFYPEGGYSMYGSKCKIAFKAMQCDGKEIDITGIVYDRQGNELIDFKTDIYGMGVFDMTPEPGETYYTVCTNSKGHSKRFDLPVAKTEGYTLSATWFRDQLTVKVLQPEHQATGDTLCLLVHTRGVMQDVRIWENINESVTFQSDIFPSGVTNLLLLTKDMIPVSERLVFVNNDDQANVMCATDKDVYPAGSPVEYTVDITDESGYPLQGNISVSVTDDHEVAVDTTSNILTSLLLTSDLRGNISDPAFYFQKNNRQSTYALDLLMLTQGWRRYDTERIVRNDPMYPDTLLGKGYEISGTVTATTSKRPEVNANVSLLAHSRANFSGNTVTDNEGRFYLHDGDAPDSIVFIVQATPQSGNRRLELTLDRPSFPERTIPAACSDPPNPEVFAKYAEKAEQKYVDEHGIRMVYLSEVTISAPKKHQSKFYTTDYSITEEEIAKRPPASMSSLLNRLPGVSARQSLEELTVSIDRFGDCPAMFLVDDFFTDNIDNIEVGDVAQADLIKDVGNLAFWGDSAPCGIISLFTKRGDIPKVSKETPYIKYIMPLGFQNPAAFYAPKYDTPALNTKPDLRTTIHWEPNLTTDEEGNATFSFYTADTPSTYTVVIEGITEDGKIVYKRDKIIVGSEK